MSDEQPANSQSSEERADSKADVRAAIIVFAAVLLMTIHFVSGFTFDF